MNDDTLAKLREWLEEQRNLAGFGKRNAETSEQYSRHAGGWYAYGDVLEWLDRNAKGGQDEHA